MSAESAEQVTALTDPATRRIVAAAKRIETPGKGTTAWLYLPEGRLAAPDELAFDEAHLDDEEALTAAIDDLLARKPYLAARRPVGDVAQGASPVAATVDLAGLIRRNAG